MDVILLNENGLFLSPDIDDWQTVKDYNITVIIDLDGDLDIGVPTVPNEILYIYFPIRDGELPDLVKLHAIGKLGAELISNGHRVLCHCLMGLNRSALVAGAILVALGMTGQQALNVLQERRPGALYNEVFAEYLCTLC